jgi:uncharacterized protein (TIGR02147 family)
MKLTVQLEHESLLASMTQTKIYREMLVTELHRRMAKNRAYSIRAYARDLGLSVSRLSETLSEKSGLSSESAKKIANRMDWSPSEATVFVHSVQACHGRSALVRANAVKALKKSEVKAPQRLIKRDQFRLMSRWYFMAIPELFALDQFEVTAKSVAAKLAIPFTDAQEALWGLEKLGLVQKTETGWSAPSTYKVVPSGTPSKSIRSFHQQMIAKAEASIEQQGVDERDLSCVVLSVGEGDLEIAKEMIKKFRRKLNQTLSARANKKEHVYSLGIQFFRISAKGNH